MRDNLDPRFLYDRDDDEQFRGTAAAWAVLVSFAVLIIVALTGAAWWTR